MMLSEFITMLDAAKQENGDVPILLKNLEGFRHVDPARVYMTDEPQRALVVEMHVKQ